MSKILHIDAIFAFFFQDPLSQMMEANLSCDSLPETAEVMNFRVVHQTKIDLDSSLMMDFPGT